ncbi:MAG: OmpA family protein [Saprospiraceae bacterium]
MRIIQQRTAWFMLLRDFFVLVLGLFFTFQLAAQTQIDGYVFEANNRGYLNQVKVRVFGLTDNSILGEVETDTDGHFVFDLPEGKYRVQAEKDIFFERNDTVMIGKEKVFLKIELRRRPGYLFDATIAEVRESPDQIVDAIQGATVEIYNRSTRQTELTIKEDTDAFFNFTFERGNHYTMLIRKEGFLTKRIEVYVNVNGCIVCVDGVREISPGVTDNLAAGNNEGTLLANIELDRARIDKRIQIQNIYYDYDKWDIRADAAERLDNVVTLMKDNPGISVELGSHTDSRGNDDYNQKLSQRRAAAAVAYIVSEGVDSTRITARGYGESQLANRCRNGVECSEEEHQNNRRTVLRITGISEKTSWLTLKEIIEKEEMERSNKKKPARDKRLPEANNSVPLPELKPPSGFNGFGEPVFPVQKQGNPSNSKPMEDIESDIRILQLPPTFKGCAVELARSSTELPANHAAFRGQKEVFRLLENDGKFTYLIANLGTKDAATSFFKKKIKPVNKTAKLVLYTENGKEYLSE